jgi:hypothetical protein
MQTLSKGYKLPETGDKGTLFFPALEFNIQRLNDHTHDGTDSAQLSASAISAITDTISFAGWSLVSGGTYKQTVTMPVGLDFDDYVPTFRNLLGHILYLSVEKVTASTYDVYINDPTQSLVVTYTT